MSSTEPVKYVTGYPVFAEGLKSLPQFAQEAAHLMFAKAIGYGWGRIDSTEWRRPAHGGDALDFAAAYGLAYVSKSGAVPALREAFAEWMEKGYVS